MSRVSVTRAASAALAALAVAGCGGSPAPRAPQPPAREHARHALSRPPSIRSAGSCYGAAAAAPGHVCDDPRFATMVYPAPRVAASLISPSPCHRAVARGLVRACWWGRPARHAKRLVALIGDSHASVWRPAFEQVVRAKGWRAVSLSRAGCPLTLAHPRLPGLRRQWGCMAWNRQVQAFVHRRRRLSVVFLAAHRGHVLPPPGQSPYEAQLSGYENAIRALLRAGIRRVVVLRDTPRSEAVTLGCIESAVAVHRAPGAACAVPRAYALRSDPLVQAARALGSAHVDVIDLSRLWCGPASCPPVIGGVLVLRDRQHMTDAFSQTLGPFLLRDVTRLEL